MEDNFEPDPFVENNPCFNCKYKGTGKCGRCKHRFSLEKIWNRTEPPTSRPKNPIWYSDLHPQNNVVDCSTPALQSQDNFMEETIKQAINNISWNIASKNEQVCKALVDIGINPKNCFFDEKDNLIIPCFEIQKNKTNKLSEFVSSTSQSQDKKGGKKFLRGVKSHD